MIKVRARGDRRSDLGEFRVEMKLPDGGTGLFRLAPPGTFRGPAGPIPMKGKALGGRRIGAPAEETARTVALANQSQLLTLHSPNPAGPCRAGAASAPLRRNCRPYVGAAMGRPPESGTRKIPRAGINGAGNRVLCRGSSWVRAPPGGSSWPPAPPGGSSWLPAPPGRRRPPHSVRGGRMDKMRGCNWLPAPPGQSSSSSAL